MISVSAPCRVDLAWGTLDIWPVSQIVPEAVTVNLARELRAHAVVEPRRDGRVVVNSRDRRRRAPRRLPLVPSDAGGPLALVLRLVGAFRPGSGLTLTLRAEAPAGAGLGGASALGIAVGAALNRFTRAGLGRRALLRRVMNVETAELRVPTGNQDYLAAIHGGLAAYHHGFDGTAREAIRVPPGLERRLVLAYTGRPRRSGYSNWEMFRRFVEGDRTTVRRMERIASIARKLRCALVAGDLDETGRLLGEEGRLRSRLAPTVATPGLLAAETAARRAGALGAKVCGAGGGGCLVAFAREGKTGAVARAISDAGSRLLPFRIARRGVEVSEPQAES